MTSSNPRATKQNGIWCKAEYPVTAWEDPACRVVLPASLQAALVVDEPILRWSRDKRRKVLRDHAVDASVILNVAMHLEHWRYCGQERKNHHVWRVLFVVDSRWYALTLGRDDTYNLDIITVFRSASASFLRNRLRGLRNIVENAKMTSG